MLYSIMYCINTLLLHYIYCIRCVIVLLTLPLSKGQGGFLPAKKRRFPEWEAHKQENGMNDVMTDNTFRRDL